MRNYIQPYFIVPRYVREGTRFKIKDIDFIVKCCKPKKGFMDGSTNI